MKNIFEENDILREPVNAIKLSGKQLVLYEKYKRSLLVEFVLFFLYFGIHRYLMRDKFSKIYGTFLYSLRLLRRYLDYHYTVDSMEKAIIGECFLLIFFVLWIIELVLLKPLVERHNLTLKKQIAEGEEIPSMYSSYTWISICVLLTILYAIAKFINMAYN